jgi:hypothetical protein
VWPRGWVEVQLYSSITAALEGGEGSAARPGRTLPPGKTRYPFYRRLGGPPGPVWTCGKSRLHRDSIPDRPARSSEAIPTELPVKRVEFVNDRVSYIVLRGRWCNVIVLNVHALSKEKSDDSGDSFYEE